MILTKEYKITYQGKIAIVDRIVRGNIEDAFGIMDDLIIDDIASDAQPGWVTDEGVFLNGEEALAHALECDQIDDVAKKLIEKYDIKALQKSFLKTN